MGGYRIISADNHVFEPPDLWTSRLDSRFIDVCPKPVPSDQGPIWVADGRASLSFSQGTQAGLRFEDPFAISPMGEWENVRPGAYDPDEAVKDMDVDGVDVGVIYPTVGLLLYTTVRNTPLMDAICSAYNDFLGEFCSAHPQRLKGIAMLNVDDVPTGMRELERCAKMGFAGAMIPAIPPRGRTYDLPMYESLWSAANEAEMPLSFHVTTPRPGSDEEFRPDVMDDLLAFGKTLLINGDHWVRLSISDLIFAGVFERYPKLKVLSVEHELAWVPHFIQRMDWYYNNAPAGLHGFRYTDERMPSDVFHEHVFVDFQEDPLGMRLRDVIGVDNILWGSDYPHVESTWPRSRAILDELLADCSEEEKAKIAGGNAARVFRI